MKSREEILRKHLGSIWSHQDFEALGKYVYAAMEEYASQQAPPVSAMEDGWTEIKEGCNMPSDNEDCLVWTELATKWQASTFKNKKFYRYSNAVESDRMALYYFPDVVKWMPLPPPPSNR